MARIRENGIGHNQSGSLREPERFQRRAVHIVEAEVAQPDNLISGVNGKFAQLRREGTRIIDSNYGMTATLEAPVSIFSYAEVPQELRNLAEISAQDRMRVRILSRGSSSGGEPAPFYVDPFVAIDFTIFPNLIEAAPINLRISQIGAEEPKIKIRRGKNIPDDITNSAELLRFFLRNLGRAKETWGGIEDYIEDLRELSIGHMDPRDFAQYVEKPMRFTENHLAGLKRKSGEPAVEHSYRAVRRFMLAGEFDVYHLATLALHDAWEDGPKLKQNGPYQPWLRKARDYIAGEYGSIVAKRVMILTRPREDRDNVISDEEGREIYAWNMSRDPESAYDKIPDRLDNVETIDALPPEDQIRTLKETIAYIKNIFMNERVRRINPKAWKILMERMVLAVEPHCERYRIDIPAEILALKGKS